MVSTLSIFHVLCFIFVTIIFPNFAESKCTSSHHNRTDHAWKGRSKRSLFDEMQTQLRITVRYATGEKINLVYKKIPQYLANEHLPVITSYVRSDPSIMEEVGETVLYHDVSKCSAVVYFAKLKTLYGVIGMNYHLRDLPYAFDENGTYQLGIVGEPYVKNHEVPSSHIHPADIYPPQFDADAWYDFLRPSRSNSEQSSKRPSDSDQGPSTKRQRTEQDFDEKATNADEYQISTISKSFADAAYQHYYLETLIFVTYDIAELFKEVFGDLYIRWIVRHLIIYFNAVDMMFQKTEIMYPKIHINIAKVVIETESMPFTFINTEELQFMETVRRSRQYLRRHKCKYATDSFDQVFIYTSRQIFDGSIQVNGMTKYGEDLYEARKNNEYYNAVPITLVRFQKYYVDYVVTVHEIGRILHMNVDPREKGLQYIGQCYGIMQREGPKCHDCLKWSDESQFRFGVFLRENRNRCFLLNEPRSLRSPGASIFLRATTQCECFGYHSHMKYASGLVVNLVGIDGCRKPLQCQIGCGMRSSHASASIPFDGTPCASNKVCWQQKCIVVRNTRISTIRHAS